MEGVGIITPCTFGSDVMDSANFNEIKSIWPQKMGIFVKISYRNRL